MSFSPGLWIIRKLRLYQAACDILLMPYEKAIAGSSGGNSVDICSPMKMFEYMAAGRAIISSDLPVIHEMLDEGRLCFVRRRMQHHGYRRLAKLIADPLRQEFNCQSRKR